MSYKFEPDEKVRNFEAQSLIGKPVEIRYQHTDADNEIRRARYDHEKKAKECKDPGPFVPPTPTPTKQFIACTVSGLEDTMFGDWGLHANTWSPKLLPKGTDVGGVVEEAWLMEHSNGGRGDHARYTSYQDWIDGPDRRERCARRWTGGLLAIIAGPGGDPDRFDVCFKVKVTSGEHEGAILDFEAQGYGDIPGEWYSECFAGLNDFKCVDGFYPDADRAVEVFKQKATDDMFGTRYFPVISIDDSHANVQKLEEAAWLAKGSSSPIVSNGRLFFGLRCKPYEFEECIRKCYELGGEVPVGLTWNWGG